MFSEIEKEYKKGLQHRRFIIYYWPKVVVIGILLVLGGILFGIDHWIVYIGGVIALVFLVGLFFVREFTHMHRVIKETKLPSGTKGRMQAYFKVDDARRIERLARDLVKHGVETRKDVKVTLNYFQSRLPMTAKPNFLEWFLTTVVTVASIILVTYNDEAGSINTREFELALVVAGYFLTPFVIAKIITTAISVSRTKVDTVLVEDLAQIYVNYEKYGIK